jgi:hypothetical protein
MRNDVVLYRDKGGQGYPIYKKQKKCSLNLLSCVETALWNAILKENFNLVEEEENALSRY